MNNLALLEDEETSTLLHTYTNSNIANFITHEACQKYFKEFKSQWIPITFIEFYFDEYKRFDFMSQEYLTPFFKLYTNEDIYDIIDNYYHASYSVIKKQMNKRDQIHYYIENDYHLESILYYPEVLGNYQPDLYQNLGFISKHFNNNDEVISLKEAYEYFMLKKTILDYDNKKNLKTQKAITHINPVKEEEEKRINTPLVGNETSLPNQKGKVVKLYFPRFNLPSPYPILLDSSRIDSTHKASRFARVDKQIGIINDYKFNKVKYTVAFIEKRIAAKKPAKRKFEFDF